jgi:transposase-like protein
MNLIDVTAEFNTDGKCLDYLEALRWPNGVCCIACGSVKVSRITRESKTKNKRKRLYQCLEPQCKHQFSPTAGTIFHDSHLPLRKWFAAIALVCEAKKGLSTCQMRRHLKVNYRTAWHLCHRIREAMKEPRFMFSGNSPVEVDETFIGGRLDKRRKQPQTKIAVMGLVERGGKVQALKIPSASAPILVGVVKRRVPPGSRVLTDQLRSYTGLRNDYDHDVINHIKEFGRGDIHTNTIENFWSLLNRGIVGSYHKVSIKHLDRYLAEFTYRFNRRDQQEQLFAETTKNLLRGKVLTYDNLTASTVSGF